MRADVDRDVHAARHTCNASRYIVSTSGVLSTRRPTITNVFRVIARPARPATIILNVRAVGAIEVVVRMLESRGVRLDGRKGFAGVVSLGVSVSPSSVVVVSV